MSFVDVRSLHKTLGRNQVLKGVSFAVEEGKLLTLLGPSGCGKSTTLKCIAGLDSPDAGEIWIGGHKVVGPGIYVPASRRNLGMVFQSYALWPHMTVHDNVAFPLRVRQTGAAEANRRVGATLELVGLGPYRSAYPGQLSGGQQQRVALARALVYQPRMILLDEPLSNLDAQLRDQMRQEIVRVQREAGITAIYVTHDRTEALAMSDSMCVMGDGRVVQHDAPQAVWDAPRNRYVAEFLGMQGLFDCAWVGADGPWAAVAVGGARIGAVVDPAAAGRFGAGVPACVLLDVSRIELAVAGPAAGAPSGHGNRLPGVVAGFTLLGDQAEVEVDLGGQVLRLRRERHRLPALADGQEVTLSFAREHARVLPVEDAPVPDGG